MNLTTEQDAELLSTYVNPRNLQTYLNNKKKRLIHENLVQLLENQDQQHPLDQIPWNIDGKSYQYSTSNPKDNNVSLITHVTQNW